MTHRENKTKLLVYPEQKIRQLWNLFMTLVLLVSCIKTPLDIAFSKETDYNIFDISTDCLFMCDIIVIFNSAFYDEEMNLVEDRGQIACTYLSGWFLIDFLAVIPFDVILQNFNSNLYSLVRIARFGRFYKLIKLTRLLRILKIMRERNKLMKYLSDILKIGLGFERLFFFILIFMLVLHITTCLWVITATIYDEEYVGTWLEKYK